jgi:hypothetical protein
LFSEREKLAFQSEGNKNANERSADFIDMFPIFFLLV